jgi:hypothetical protein
MIMKLTGIGNPLTVGRPAGAEIVARAVVEIGVYFDWCFLLDIDVPEIEALVEIGNVFVVGRPSG